VTRQEMMHTLSQPRPLTTAGAELGLPHGGLMAPGCATGGLVRITPKLEYTLNPADSQTVDIVLAKYVDTTLWVSGVLVVRVHAATVGTGQSFQVKVQSTSFAEEEPASDFVYTATDVAAVTINTSTPAAPTLLRDVFAAPIAAQVGVILRATQGTGGSSLSCTLGVDLVGRQA